MGVIELVIVGMVLFGIWQFIRKQTSESTRDLSRGAVTGVFILLGVLGAIAVAALLVVRTVPYSTQESVVSGDVSSANEYISRRSSSNDHSITAEEYDLVHNHVSHQVAAPHLKLSWLVIISTVAAGLLIGVMLLNALRGSSVAGYGLIAFACFAMGFLLFGYRSLGQVKSAQLKEAQAVLATAKAANDQAARHRETLQMDSSKTKPPIQVDKKEITPDPDLDINAPKGVVNIRYSETSITTSSATDTLPKWLEEAMVQEGDRFRTVIHSDRYATTEEAVSSIMPQIRNLIVQNVMSNNHIGIGSFTVPADELTIDALQGTVITRRCDIAYPLLVGGFEEEVYEVAVEIDIDTTAREKLYAMWRPAEVNERLTYLGIAVGSITLLLGAGAFMTRRKVA